MENAYIISGIDTDCGKTFITGRLAKILKKSGKRVITQKLSQTGCNSISEDIIEHRKIMECDLFPEDTDGTTCPYVFSFPASPHIAAQLQNNSIRPEVLNQSTQKLICSYEVVLIEGVGGLCVPLSNTLLLVDYIAETNLKLILISSSKLGSINHTILSLEMCKQKNIPVYAVVYNIFPDTNPLIIKSSWDYLSMYISSNFPNTIFCTDSSLNKLFHL